MRLSWNVMKKMEFIHSTDFDKNWWLYFLGSYAKRKTYTNPVLIPLMNVNASSLAMDSKSIYTFVGECVRCMTDDTSKNMWIKVNIHLIHLCLTQYSLKHHSSHNAAATLDIIGEQWRTAMDCTKSAQLWEWTVCAGRECKYEVSDAQYIIKWVEFA